MIADPILCIFENPLVKDRGPIIISEETHQNKWPRNHKCDSCGKTFTEAGVIKRHIRTIHEGQKNYKCDSCGKSFTGSQCLKIHIITIHEGQRNYKCDSCGKDFAQSGDLKKHIKRIHDIGGKEHSCDIFIKYFLNQHTSKAHGNQW